MPAIAKASHRPEAKKKSRIRPRNSWAMAHALGIGIVISVFAHSLIPVIQFAPMDASGNKQNDRGLQIVLVNAKHARAPKDAQAIAQANMDGGGNTDTKDLATSPLPPERNDQDGDSLTEANKQLAELEARQRALLAQAKGVAAIEQNQGKQSKEPTQSDSAKAGDSPDDKTRAMAKQEAVVDRLLRQYAARPRKTVIAPRTKESRFALYAESWRHAVEEMGTLKFPKGSDGKPIYGSVMLSIDIDRKGKLVEVKVERSSGSKRLDEAAMHIVEMAAPFKPFPADVARDTDILELVRTFVFQQTLGVATLDVKGGPNP